MAEIICGKTVSSIEREKIKNEIIELKRDHGTTPGLAVILVGDDPASQIYVRNKHRACLDVGINSYQIHFSENVSSNELLSKIDELNSDDRVHGILVQLPLPSHIDEKEVIKRISPYKDVDSFSPYNMGNLLIGEDGMPPCTPAGIIKLLEHYNVDISGKRCAVIGRSNIVGKPIALMLLQRNGTVTVCHSRTNNLSEITRAADIVISAVGKPAFLTADMVKEGVVVIDVGINRLSDGRLVGDVNFDGVSKLASLITPVPGGVGPMTITMLLRNTLTAAKRQRLK